MAPIARPTFRRNQFSLASIILLTMLVAVVVRWPQVWLFILVGQLVLVLLCINYLIRNIPKGILSAMKRNCVLPDGSWCLARENIEVKSIEKYRKSLFALFGLILIPANLLFWIAASNQPWFDFRTANNYWLNSLGGDSISMSIPEISSELRLVTTVILVAWGLFGAVLLFQGHMRTLNELLFEAKLRSRNYRLTELEMLNDCESSWDDSAEIESIARPS